MEPSLVQKPNRTPANRSESGGVAHSSPRGKADTRPASRSDDTDSLPILSFPPGSADRTVIPRGLIHVEAANAFLTLLCSISSTLSQKHREKKGFVIFFTKSLLTLSATAAVSTSPQAGEATRFARIS